MKKIITLLFATVVTISITGCAQKQYVSHAAPQHEQKKPKKYVKQMRPQELKFNFGYPSEALNELPTLSLDNVKKRTGYVTLVNLGDKDLSIKEIKSLSPSSKLFNVKNNCNTLLKKNVECKIFVRFIGDKAGKYTQAIVIKSDDPKRSTIKIKVEAKAVQKMTVTEFSVSANIKDFLQDKVSTKDGYYPRLVFQTWIDETLHNEMKSKFDKV